jgi:hypothetical protein
LIDESWKSLCRQKNPTIRATTRMIIKKTRKAIAMSIHENKAIEARIMDSPRKRKVSWICWIFEINSVQQKMTLVIRVIFCIINK